MWMLRAFGAVVVSIVCTAAPVVAQNQRRVVVVEESGGTVAGAQLLLRNASGVVLHQGTTDSDGTCTIDGLPLGRYWMEVSARDFQVHQSTVELAEPGAPLARVVLSLAGLQSNVTVNNLFDRSYRVHGSGVDAPGVSVYACLSVLY